MPFLIRLTITVLGGILVGMLVFMLARRVWRVIGFRRRDRFRESWFRRLPALCAGDTPTAEEMRAPEAREMLEMAIINCRETAEPEDQKRLQELAERSGLEEERIRRAWKAKRPRRWGVVSRWDRLESFRGGWPQPIRIASRISIKGPARTGRRTATRTLRSR